MPFAFRDDVHELKDLKPGMVCPGIVTNVTNFGAFVDIGVHQDGLVHISQLADRFVKDPQRGGERGRPRHGARPRGQARQEADRADDEERARGRAPGRAPGGQTSAGRDRGQGGQGGKDRPPPPSKPATPFNNPFAAALANKNPRR